MKYSTPSIEVVTFNASDAPRIGMQWWYESTSSTWTPVPAGWNPSNIGDVTTEVTVGNNGLENCTQVTFYATPNSGEAYIWDARLRYNDTFFTADDGQSC